MHVFPHGSTLVAFISKSNQQTLYTYMKGIDKRTLDLRQALKITRKNPAVIFLQRVAREGLK